MKSAVTEMVGPYTSVGKKPLPLQTKGIIVPANVGVVGARKRKWIVGADEPIESIKTV
jgi:hypothetical protein